MLDVGFDFLGGGVDKQKVGEERFKYPFLFAVDFLQRVVQGEIGFRAVVGQVFVGFVYPGVGGAQDKPLFCGVWRVSYRHPCW